MSTFSESRWTIWSLLSLLFSPILAVVMPRHAKRLFYFASLYANLLPVETLKQDAMARLNTAMDLASSDDALMMPAVLSRMVWSHDDVTRILEHSDQPDKLELRAYELLSIIPKWMQFDAPDKMKEETMKFLRFSDHLNVQSVAG